MTDPTERALLRSIVANPAEDTPRLVYADWLDERAGTVPCRGCTGPHGEPYHGVRQRGCPTCRGTGTVSDGRAERAELIRVQCGLARLPDAGGACPGCGYDPADGYHHNRPDCPVYRAGELLTEERRREWARVPCPTCGGDPDNLALRCPCPACQNTGDAMQRAENPSYDGTKTATPHWHRGFVERVEVPALSWLFERVAATCKMCRGAGWCECPESGLDADCPQCHGTRTDSTRTEWRVTLPALAVASTHPVAEFVMGDREPAQLGGKWGWWENGAEERHQIGRLLWPAMYEPGGVRREWHDTREQALNALATAAADVVRAAVLAAWAQEGRT